MQVRRGRVCGARRVFSARLACARRCRNAADDRDAALFIQITGGTSGDVRMSPSPLRSPERKREAERAGRAGWTGGAAALADAADREENAAAAHLTSPIWCSSV